MFIDNYGYSYLCRDPKTSGRESCQSHAKFWVDSYMFLVFTGGNMTNFCKKQKSVQTGIPWIPTLSPDSSRAYTGAAFFHLEWVCSFVCSPTGPRPSSVTYLAYRPLAFYPHHILGAFLQTADMLWLRSQVDRQIHGQLDRPSLLAAQLGFLQMSHSALICLGNKTFVS